MTLRERLGLPTPPRPEPPKAAPPPPPKPAWLARLPARDFTRAVTG